MAFYWRGDLPQIAAYAARLAPGAALAIVTDEFARTHLPAVAASLAEAGFRHECVVVAPGEDFEILTPRSRKDATQSSPAVSSAAISSSRWAAASL